MLQEQLAQRGMYGGGAGAGFAHNGGGVCGVAQGEECTACGVGCGGGGAGSGAMSYVGPGAGGYIQETTYRYVGCGGDFDVIRRRRDFTCLVACCLLPLLLLLPFLLWWLFCPQEPYDCNPRTDGDFIFVWGEAKREYC